MIEINESDLDFVIKNLKVTKKGKIGNKARSILKKCLKDEIGKRVGGLL